MRTCLLLRLHGFPRFCIMGRRLSGPHASVGALLNPFNNLRGLMRFNTAIYVVLLLLVLTVGAYARFALLDLRPMHGDEANQAVKFITLLEDGVYHYDPNEHHGPTLYYAALLPAWLQGIYDGASLDEVTLRLTPAIFGILTLLLIPLLRPVLGRVGVVVAMLLLATSPAMVYYSRYFVQETLLLTLTMGALVLAWRYLHRPTLAAALGLGACLGLMHATKETCILFFGALALAALTIYLVTPGNHRLQSLPKAVPPKHLLAMLLTALGLSVLLFSAFFTYPRGILDSVLTYVDYAARAEGEGSAAIHEQPWYYYLSLLLYTQREVGPRWSEAGILLLGVLGMLAAWWPSKRADAATHPARPYLRFLALYTLLLTLFFSVIPYKTPWNLLGFHLGFILLSGFACQWLWQCSRHWAWRSACGVLIALITGHLAWQSHLANTRYPADPRNPYVYAHTSTAFMRFVARVGDIQAVHPEPENMLVRVMQPDGDYWPIPWYLRGVGQVGYHHDLPEQADADIIIADMALMEPLEARLAGDYQMEATSLRPGVLRLVFIERALWDRFMEDRR